MEGIYALAGLLAPMLISFAISFLVGWLLLRWFVQVLSTSQRMAPKPASSRNTSADRH